MVSRNRDGELRIDDTPSSRSIEMFEIPRSLPRELHEIERDLGKGTLEQHISSSSVGNWRRTPHDKKIAISRSSLEKIVRLILDLCKKSEVGELADTKKTPIDSRRFAIDPESAQGPRWWTELPSQTKAEYALILKEQVAKSSDVQARHARTIDNPGKANHGFKALLDAEAAIAPESQVFLFLPKSLALNARDVTEKDVGKVVLQNVGPQKRCRYTYVMTPEQWRKEAEALRAQFLRLGASENELSAIHCVVPGRDGWPFVHIDAFILFNPHDAFANPSGYRIDYEGDRPISPAPLEAREIQRYWKLLADHGITATSGCALVKPIRPDFAEIAKRVLAKQMLVASDEGIGAKGKSMSVLGSWHAHIDVTNNPSLLLRLEDFLSRPGRRWRLRTVIDACRGPQASKRDFAATYEAHDPSKNGGFDYFITVGLGLFSDPVDAIAAEVRTLLHLLDGVNGATIELERVCGVIKDEISEWVCGKPDPNLWGQLAAPALPGYLGRPGLKEYEIHVAVDLPTDHVSERIEVASSLKQISSLPGISLGGLFCFHEERSISYRTNAFSDADHVIAAATRQHHALCRHFRKQLPKAAAKTLVERVIGIWNYNNPR